MMMMFYLIILSYFLYKMIKNKLLEYKNKFDYLKNLYKKEGCLFFTNEKKSIKRYIKNIEEKIKNEENKIDFNLNVEIELFFKKIKRI